MNYAITVNEVRKKFGRPGSAPWKRFLKMVQRSNGNDSANGKSSKNEVVAVNSVTFHVREGEIFGVLGPNGSGKSTLIRLMATLLLPDDGQIHVFGQNVVT